MNDTKNKPSRWYYGLAVLVVLLGNIVSSAMFLRDFGHFEKSLRQFIVPGEYSLDLTTPGIYTIFHEYRSVVNNQIFSSPPDSIRGLKCTVLGSDGKEIDLLPNSWSSTYKFSGREGMLLYEFKITEPGTYMLKAHYDDGVEPVKTVLAIVEGFIAHNLRALVSFAGVGIVSIVIAGFIAYVTFKKRRRIVSMKNES